MDINEFAHKLTEFGITNENYKKWREIHGKLFGDFFLGAFEESYEAQIHFTAAVTNISENECKKALGKLKIAESLCNNEHDEMAVNYFSGLCYELTKDLKKMEKYYSRLLCSDINLIFPLAFTPYYRTAKFAQRDSECTKAIYYYKKALEIYKDKKLSAEQSKIVSFIYYDLATVYLYCHEYEKSVMTMEKSYRYDSSQNSFRDYVVTVLNALSGEKARVGLLLSQLSPHFIESCKPMTEAIFKGEDLHYYVVPQDRTKYRSFWDDLINEKEDLEDLILNRKSRRAAKVISRKLTKMLPFVQRDLACKIEKTDTGFIVRCKNYCVKTLNSEYEALFSMKPESFENWEFVSVNEFEKGEYK